MYVADWQEHNVRRVDPDSIITTIAGPVGGITNPMGSQRFGGDVGPATAARFYFPTAMPLAPDGSLYVCDTGNRVEFLPTGEELRTTLLPDGTEYATLIGIDGSRAVVQADGTEQDIGPGHDSRFGMQAPVEENGAVMRRGHRWAFGVGRWAFGVGHDDVLRVST
jgi:hypothetical protein